MNEHRYGKIIANLDPSSRNGRHGALAGLLRFVAAAAVIATLVQAGVVLSAQSITAPQPSGGEGSALGAPPAAGGETVELELGVMALRLPSREAPAQSMLVADAGLLGLAHPEERQAFDRLVAQAAPDRALLVIVTATEEGSWRPELLFRQAGDSVLVAHPFRLRILSGDPLSVGPDRPVLAVALLPERFSLRLPITIEWGGSSGVVTFRR